MRRTTTHAIAVFFLLSASTLASAQSNDTPAAGVGQPGSAGAGLYGSVNSVDQLRSRLRAEGYGNVQIVKKDAAGWSATASKDGREVSINVDNSGRILTR
jgi:hypothetical protein